MLLCYLAVGTMVEMIHAEVGSRSSLSLGGVGDRKQKIFAPQEHTSFALALHLIAVDPHCLWEVQGIGNKKYLPLRSIQVLHLPFT